MAARSFGRENYSVLATSRAQLWASLMDSVWSCVIRDGSNQSFRALLPSVLKIEMEDGLS